eukprot:EG_transcript_16113
MPPGIPVIDLSLWRSGGPGAEAVVRAWDAAFRAAGFAVVTGHGVDVMALKRLQVEVAAFFRQPTEAKMACCLHRGYGAGGYVAAGVEAVARSKGGQAAPDPVESFVFKSETDAAAYAPLGPEFAAAVRAYWAEMRRLLLDVLRLSACALGLEPDFFLPSHTPGDLTLRLAHYSAVPSGATGDRGVRLRYGAHTDYTGFTLLFTDGPGLEVDFDGQWLPVPVMAEAFVVNAGDLIAQWTNDVWKSGLHRVVWPPAPTQERQSLVFFTGPNDDYVVEPLSTCTGPDHPPRYPAVQAGEYLRQKLQITNV